MRPSGLTVGALAVTLGSAFSLWAEPLSFTPQLGPCPNLSGHWVNIDNQEDWLEIRMREETYTPLEAVTVPVAFRENSMLRAWHHLEGDKSRTDGLLSLPHVQTISYQMIGQEIPEYSLRHADEGAWRDNYIEEMTVKAALRYEVMENWRNDGRPFLRHHVRRNGRVVASYASPALTPDEPFHLSAYREVIQTRCEPGVLRLDLYRQVVRTDIGWADTGFEVQISWQLTQEVVGGRSLYRLHYEKRSYEAIPKHQRELVKKVYDWVGPSQGLWRRKDTFACDTSELDLGACPKLQGVWQRVESSAGDTAVIQVCGRGSDVAYWINGMTWEPGASFHADAPTRPLRMGWNRVLTEFVPGPALRSWTRHEDDWTYHCEEDEDRGKVLVAERRTTHLTRRDYWRDRATEAEVEKDPACREEESRPWLAELECLQRKGWRGGTHTETHRLWTEEVRVDDRTEMHLHIDYEATQVGSEIERKRKPVNRKFDGLHIYTWGGLAANLTVSELEQAKDRMFSWHLNWYKPAGPPSLEAVRQRAPE